ncbi:DUF4276 family protein (plasmid) [Haloimpatiens sp. FM7330]|uniref:DUF4276 family protein n=1 Tax=Haloimpatiens sp. FM7330 TaxID=3298610 RepID=UPI003643B127
MGKKKKSSQKRKKLALIFLEGYTEDVFYKNIFQKYLQGIPKKTKNLKTGTNINRQIVNELYHFMSNKSNEIYDLYIYVFIDKEGSRNDISQFNNKAILKKLKEYFKCEQIKVIDKIEAIIMIESWFFHDLEGICKYIGISFTDSLKRNYANPERLKALDLSKLFKKGNKKKHYKKGDEGFLTSLNIDTIYNNCSDLKEGIIKIRNNF